MDIARRVETLLSWFGLDIEISEESRRKYNEASLVRNIILHRYGYLDADDIAHFPELAAWEGTVLQITTERLNAYNKAIVTVHLAITDAVFKSAYR